MDSQHATCTSCNHSFRLPAGASADSKCPQCGGAVTLALARTPARARSAKPEATAPARSRPARAATGEEPKGKAAGAGRGARRGAPAAEGKKSPAPLALGGAGAVVVLFGVWFFAFRGEKEAPPAIAAEAVQTLDLSKLPDLKPLEGTTDEEWAAMNELMTRYCTPPFSPASVPHGDRLVIRGMRAVPVILNGFKRLDLATAAGAEIGWKVQTLLLQGLCHDTNFGWRRETRPADILFNQQVIQRWFKAWEVAGENAETWAEIARLKDIPPALQAQGGTAEMPAAK